LLITCSLTFLAIITNISSTVARTLHNLNTWGKRCTQIALKREVKPRQPLVHGLIQSGNKQIFLILNAMAFIGLMFKVITFSTTQLLQCLAYLSTCGISWFF